MNNEAIFYQKVIERRVPLSEIGREGFVERAVLYVNSAVNWAKYLEIDGVPVQKLSLTGGSVAAQKALFALEEFLDEVRARNIFVLEPGLLLGTVKLDAKWKDHVTTLISHIRDVVTKADMAENLREPILRSLNNLQAQVDKNRTRTEAIAQTWLEITGAIGEGAKNLEPAVKLVEKLSKAFRKAERLQIEAQDQPKLPPPAEVMDEDE